MLNYCLELTDEVIAGFFEWLVRDNPSISEKSLRGYRYYIPKLIGVKLCGKESIKDVFERIGFNKSSYEAFSRLLSYIEKGLDGYENLANTIRKALPKKPRSKMDTYVPPDDKVVELGECLLKHGAIYRLFYLVLVYSGCRGIEAYFLLNNARDFKVVDLGYGAVRIHLPPTMQRGVKNEYVIYLPKRLFDEILSIDGRLPHLDTFKKKFTRCGLPLKYLRKWYRQKLKIMGIDPETIEAFQGRYTSIGARHYTDWLPILDREYARIMPVIDSIINGRLQLSRNNPSNYYNLVYS